MEKVVRSRQHHPEGTENSSTTQNTEHGGARPSAVLDIGSVWRRPALGHLGTYGLFFALFLSRTINFFLLTKNIQLTNTSG